jgi:two-component system LytT family sensor kinase
MHARWAATVATFAIPRHPDAWRPAAARWLTLALWAFLCSTLLGLFFASQLLLLDKTITLRLALLYSMPRWYSWGLLAPAIVYADRWLLGGRPLGARLAWHLPLGLAWTGVNLTIRLFARPLIGNTWPASIVDYLIDRAYWDLLIYAVIAGVAVARDYAAQVRDHERRAHQLTLEAVELQRHLAEARLHTLRSQLQPHFLFNALNTISSLTESDPKSARRLMDQLGQLLRVSLRHASTPLVTLAEELTFLDDYLAIESVRFEGRITVSVHADDEALEAVVPGFLLQPLVENAIRHGVGPRLAGGHIDVAVTRGGSTLRLRVRDNGLGLAPDWAMRCEAGVGLRNTAARLEQLYPRDHLFRVTPAGAAASAPAGAATGAAAGAATGAATGAVAGAPAGAAAGAGVQVLIELPWRSHA